MALLWHVGDSKPKGRRSQRHHAWAGPSRMDICWVRQPGLADDKAAQRLTVTF